jgi:hypothetical protein
VKLREAPCLDVVAGDQREGGKRGPIADAVVSSGGVESWSRDSQL